MIEFTGQRGVSITLICVTCDGSVHMCKTNAIFEGDDVAIGMTIDATEVAFVFI